VKPNSYIGAAVNRLEDLRFLTGRGTYAGDLRSGPNSKRKPV